MQKSRESLYWIWGAMIQRCRNPRNKQYKDYGGRGITVCDRWTSYSNFAADMGPRPTDLSLDRINNNKGYSPENCKWSTRQEQNSNKRNCIYLVQCGRRRMTLSEYCRLNKLQYRPIVKRIQDRGWPVELATQIPVGRRMEDKTLALWHENQELREYLRLALAAISGYPTTERVLDEARLLADVVPEVRGLA